MRIVVGEDQVLLREGLVWLLEDEVIDPEVVSALLGRARGDPIAGLTERQREVLALMAEGRTNAGIAEELVITEKAVAKHAAGIFEALGLPP